jgi:hypothetical protein
MSFSARLLGAGFLRFGGPVLDAFVGRGFWLEFQGVEV